MGWRAVRSVSRAKLLAKGPMAASGTEGKRCGPNEGNVNYMVDLANREEHKPNEKPAKAISTDQGSVIDQKKKKPEEGKEINGPTTWNKSGEGGGEGFAHEGGSVCYHKTQKTFEFLKTDAPAGKAKSF